MAEHWAALRRRLLGIRTRVVGWYLVLFALLLAVALVAIHQVLMVRLDDRVTAALAQEAEELRLLAGGVDPATGQPFGTDVTALFDTFLDRNVPEQGELLVAVVDGEVYRTSPELLGREMLTADLVASWAPLPATTWGESDTPEGAARWLVVPVESDGGSTARFVIVDLIGDDRDDISNAVTVVAGVSLAVLALASVIGWITMGRVLAPITHVTRTARQISQDDLTARIPVVGDDELAELTRTFNEMLDRLDESFTGQRAFMDDVGHELRTPITIVRGQLELLPDDPRERAEAIAVCLDELDRMGRYVRDLITLAKSERPDFLDLADVDLAEPDRRWVIEEVAPVTTRADADRLNQAMVNLVANAAQHTQPGDRIGLGSRVRDGEVELWVADTGPGVAAEEREHIFERFGRGERAADRRAEGAGLGLAIVSAVARAHHGRVELESAPGEGACFRLVVPFVLPSQPELPTELTDPTEPVTEEVQPR